MRESNGKCHPKTLAPANDHLQSRPATVYEDKAKDEDNGKPKKKKGVYPTGYWK